MAIPGLGMLLGKVAGKVAGGAAGGAEGGLNLPNAGQLGQLGFSVGQSIMGAVKNKQADAMTPPSENPMERQMLNTIRRRRRAIETGTANAAQNASVRQLGKTMMTNAARAGGQVNYGQYNQLIGNAMGNIAAQSGQQVNQLLGQEQQQATNMVNRATDLSLLRRNEEKANAARLRQAGSQNLLATMGAGKLDKENQGLRSQSDNQNTQISSLMAIIKELQGKIAAQPAATTGL
jgi:hypothetical protein